MNRSFSAAILVIILAGLWLDSSPQARAGESVAPTIVSDSWINTPPLSAADQHGRVLLVEFWTFGCSNCRHVEPHIKAWHEQFRNKGLTVIGIHTPELAFERDADALRRYVLEHGIRYPVAMDNAYANWHAWHNWAWPAVYLVDRQGSIRYRHIGEGGYDHTEQMIRRLLNE